MIQISPRLAKEITRLTFDAFIGPHSIHPSFEIDGRCDDYEPFWVASADNTPLATDGRYSITLCDELDFNPSTLLFLECYGERVGWYGDAQLWIDPEHRGLGLGTQLVLASCFVNQGRPFDEVGCNGFSPAGAAAHRSAYFALLDIASSASPHSKSSCQAGHKMREKGRAGPLAALSYAG